MRRITWTMRLSGPTGSLRQLDVTDVVSASIYTLRELGHSLSASETLRPGKIPGQPETFLGPYHKWKVLYPQVPLRDKTDHRTWGTPQGSS